MQTGTGGIQGFYVKANRPRFEYPLHNQHVYVYYRWLTWVAGKRGRPFQQMMVAGWAEEELNAQNIQG
tara:strand:- start:254 stop:457 length:204 start_codon:yes stop_codon:yes gene_type:complete